MQQKKIVILESNKETAQETADHLRGEAFEVCGITDDGNEGIAMAERFRPDVILVSLVLKELDGFGVLDKLKSMRSTAAVIAMGSFADDELIARVLEKGARYYLMKPVSPAVVAARAKELVQPGGSGREPSLPVREKRSPVSLDEKISGIFISIGIPPNI